MGWEQQVQICSDEDSTYLRIHGDHLEWLKSHKNKLWRLLEAIVCADVSEKLYKMNEGFEKMIQQRDQVKKKALIRLSVRSVSLEALHVSSKGWNVSDNWLQAENRSKLLGWYNNSLCKFQSTTKYRKMKLSVLSPRTAKEKHLLA